MVSGPLASSPSWAATAGSSTTVAPDHLEFPDRLELPARLGVPARGLIRHLAISSGSRRRCTLPEPIQRWLEASALGGGIQPL